MLTIPFRGGGVTSNQLTYTATQSNYNFQTLPDTAELSVENKISSRDGVSKGGKLSTTAKWTIGLGLTTVASLGIYFATKGKKKINLTSAQEAKIKELISSRKIDEKSVEFFKSIEGLEGEQLIKTAYKNIAKAMGYKKYPPLKIVTLNSCSSYSHGKCITIDKDGFKSKEELIRAIRHEMEHFRQDDLIYRAFGKEAWLDALAEGSINKLKYNDTYCISKFGKKFSELTKAEIESYKLSARETYTKANRIELFDSLLKQKGQIKAGTKEYEEAKEMLQAAKDYVTPSMLADEPLTAEVIKKLKTENPEKYKLMQELNKKYNDNPLEVGANTRGCNLENKYKLFKDVVGE